MALNYLFKLNTVPADSLDQGWYNKQLVGSDIDGSVISKQYTKINSIQKNVG